MDTEPSELKVTCGWGLSQLWQAIGELHLWGLTGGGATLSQLWQASDRGTAALHEQGSSLPLRPCIIPSKGAPYLQQPATVSNSQ